MKNKYINHYLSIYISLSPSYTFYLLCF